MKKQLSYSPGYIEIEYYSVAYFKRITEIDRDIALNFRYIRVGLKRALCMSPATSRALQRASHSLEIRNRIILEFYPGLPQSQWHSPGTEYTNAQELKELRPTRTCKSTSNSVA